MSRVRRKPGIKESRRKNIFMKQVRFFLFVIAANLSFVINSYSQTDGMDADEQYCRANLAFTNPMLLGVNEFNYARCVRSENYLEPDKRGAKVVINGVDFLDDGRNNDLIANDGILTSNQLYSYSKGSIILQAGQYRLSANNFILTDPIFAYTRQIAPDRIKISCKFVWVRCSSWPQEYRQICYRMCWPFNGHFQIAECTVSYE